MQIKLLYENAIIPSYAHADDAGMDLHACIDKPIWLEPGETRLISTGIAIYIENPSLVGLVFPRSGLATKHALTLANCVGVIDSGYQGEIKLASHKFNRGKNEPYWIQPNDRIAQLIIMPIVRVFNWRVVDEFESTTERGDGGFGSSGE